MDERRALPACRLRAAGVVLQRRRPAPRRAVATPRSFDLVDEIERVPRAARGVCTWSLWPTPDLRGPGWELDGHPPLLVRPPVAGDTRRPNPRSRAQRRRPGRVGAGGRRGLPDGRPARSGPALSRPRRCSTTRAHAFWTSSEDGAPAGHPRPSSSHTARRGSRWARPCRAPATPSTGAPRPAAPRLEPDLWHVGVFSDHSRAGVERAGFVPVVRHTCGTAPAEETAMTTLETRPVHRRLPPNPVPPTPGRTPLRFRPRRPGPAGGLSRGTAWATTARSPKARDVDRAGRPHRHRRALRPRVAGAAGRHRSPVTDDPDADALARRYMPARRLRRPCSPTRST